MREIFSAIVLFIVTCAIALLLWVNWANIVDHFDKLINPETQEEQVNDETQNDEEQQLAESGITFIQLD